MGRSSSRPELWRKWLKNQALTLCEVDMMEVDNAFQQAARELTQRYDLKDSAQHLSSLRRGKFTSEAPANFVASQVRVFWLQTGKAMELI